MHYRFVFTLQWIATRDLPTAIAFDSYLS